MTQAFVRPLVVLATVLGIAGLLSCSVPFMPPFGRAAMLLGALGATLGAFGLTTALRYRQASTGAALALVLCCSALALGWCYVERVLSTHPLDMFD
jgi:hypothetical protein